MVTQTQAKPMKVKPVDLDVVLAQFKAERMAEFRRALTSVRYLDEILSSVRKVAAITKVSSGYSSLERGGGDKMQFQKSGPALTGVLQTDDKDPKKRKPLGKIALWLNESENGKAPKFRGILETEKGKFRISLWDKEEKGEESPSIFDNIRAADVVFLCR